MLPNPQCRDTVSELAVHLPSGAKLAIAPREESPVPVAGLRGQGTVAEVGVTDLAMDGRPARGLLAARRGEARRRGDRALVARAEGWPVGLYLGALALLAGGIEAPPARFIG